MHQLTSASAAVRHSSSGQQQAEPAGLSPGSAAGHQKNMPQQYTADSVSTGAPDAITAGMYTASLY
jgi:hypothetical protein